MRPLSAAALLMSLAASALAAQQVVDLPAEDRRLDPDLDEVYRVGAFEGEDWETFGDIRGTAFDASGNLYVFDRQSSRVTVVDGAGRFVRTVGSPGEGPGELRMPVGFAVMRDGQVVVADMGHRAFVLYGPEGRFQRMVSMGGDGQMVRVGDLAADPAGGALISGGGGIAMTFSSGPHGGPALPTTRPIERIALDGESARADTLAEAWQPPPPEETTTLEGSGMRLRMATPRTFEPALLVGVLSDRGVAYSESSAYAIRVTDAEGRPVRTIRRPFRPRPVTEAIREAERERRLEELEAGGGPQVSMMVRGSGGGAPQPVAPEQVREMMRSQIEQMQFYHELPVVMDLATGWGGKIWVQRRGDGPREEGPVDVLTSGGLYAGTFAAGAMGFRTRSARRDSWRSSRPTRSRCRWWWSGGCPRSCAEGGSGPAGRGPRGRVTTHRSGVGW